MVLTTSYYLNVSEPINIFLNIKKNLINFGKSLLTI